MVGEISNEDLMTEVSPDKRKEIDDNHEANLGILKIRDIKFHNLNQGEFGGRFYYGKLFNAGEGNREGIIWGKKLIIDAEITQLLKGKKIKVGKNQIKDLGLNYRHKLEYKKNFWENNGDFSIEEFLKSKENLIDIEYFYKKIYNKIERYLDLKDKRIFDVLTCWIIGTYCYELFETYGYLHFRGLKESGKSKAKKILRLIGFNGEEASSISEASFFRTIQNNKGLLCLDEYEKMDTDRKKATDLLLNAGIEQGASVKRYDVDEKMNLDFDVYCPKIICNITGLNPTTQTRVIPIEMSRTTTKKGSIKVRLKDLEFPELRNMCYCFIMENWRAIKKNYEDYDCKEITNRTEDLWLPILALSKIFGGEVEGNILGYCEYITEKVREDSVDDDIDYMILGGLLNMVSEEGRFYTNREIGDHLKMMGEINFGERQAEKVVGWHLRNFNMFKKQRTSTARGWFICQNDILEVMNSRDYPIPERFTRKSDINDIHDAKKVYPPIPIKDEKGDKKSKKRQKKTLKRSVYT